MLTAILVLTTINLICLLALLGHVTTLVGRFKPVELTEAELSNFETSVRFEGDWPAGLKPLDGDELINRLDHTLSVRFADLHAKLGTRDA